MTTGTQDAAESADGADGARTRDAGRTRRLLLDAARRRFAVDGYAVTTGRAIAADAGVNVALINRYFASKEGLFEACLQRTVEELDAPPEGPPSRDDVVSALVERITSPVPSHLLLLLLRTSGDEAADAIRRRTMRSYSERIAAASGWREDDPGTAHLLLGAQLAMALGFGTAVMRTSTGTDPLASAAPAQLEAPLREVLRVLLPAPADRPGTP